MATTAERQKAYRARRVEANQGDSDYRLNTWITSQASFALARLAAHHGVSKRTMLERLILAADEQVKAAMGDESPVRDRYIDCVTA